MGWEGEGIFFWSGGDWGEGEMARFPSRWAEAPGFQLGS